MTAERARRIRLGIRQAAGSRASLHRCALVLAQAAAACTPQPTIELSHPCHSRAVSVRPHGARPSALLYAAAVASSRSSVPSSHIVDGFSTSHSTSASCGARGKCYGMRWLSARAGRVRSPHTLLTLRTGATGRCSRSRHSSAAHGQAGGGSIRGGNGLVRCHARLIFVGTIHHSPILFTAQCARELTGAGVGRKRSAVAPRALWPRRWAWPTGAPSAARAALPRGTRRWLRRRRAAAAASSF